MRIRIAGTIVGNDEKWIYDLFGMEAFCYDDLRKAVKDDLEEINVEINSPGGSVFAGSEIYTALKNHKGAVNVDIVGLAASAASVIAMAGKRVRMSPTAQMMIHNVSARGSGDYRDMAHLSEVLKQANETIANAYCLKTGKERAEVLQMMDGEKWFTPQEAKEQGFVDEIMFEDAPQLVASFSAAIIPREVIEKLQKEREQESLNLLKLKGAV